MQGAEPLNVLLLLLLLERAKASPTKGGFTI